MGIKNVNIELIRIIVNLGMGSKLLKTAKENGISGGTVLLAHGTASNTIWDYLGLSDVRKEVVLLLADSETAQRSLEIMNKEYKFDKPNHGIAFTTSISAAVGSRSCSCNNMENERGVSNTMYHIITTIVEKGNAEKVIDAATKAGSKGGTIINGRGSGIHETSRLFSMDIEPEKEIVLILSEAADTEAIVNSIKNDLKIDEPGNGIIYVQDVNRTFGIYK
ncbi:P-II family nitrogen regulator [Anaerocolumna sp. AGMB13020]|uniref:P-II family nitrogen regulator n=1 Tax=Anaerocolumna sp. AGMB13020 TaxID=3081750 RepID=UPI002954AC0B|nr:P-II family nitrogen regulator [Anaerocolumna sp. AGMB13020]WOO36283.1 P-II family nitrogen regulator [Anaerocolumna sp. AGMB13020]